MASSATSPASILSSGRQPSCAAASGGSGCSTLFARCVAQPRLVMIRDRSLRASSMCENQSWVMNWIQNAARTLKNGAFLYAQSLSFEFATPWPWLQFGELRLIAGEQLPADHLRVGLEQADPAAVAVLRDRIVLKIGKGRFEFDVAGKQLPGRSHRRIADIVADAGQRAVADQRRPCTAASRRRRSAVGERPDVPPAGAFPSRSSASSRRRPGRRRSAYCSNVLLSNRLNRISSMRWYSRLISAPSMPRWLRSRMCAPISRRSDLEPRSPAAQ